MERQKRSLKNQIKSHSKEKVEKIDDSEYTSDDLIPMGSTLLNLAMSDMVEGGARKGRMINIIGASHGGKTILALTAFAETSRLKNYKDYAFIYDDAEEANSFNMPRLFGQSAADRIIPPRPDKTEGKNSETVQHFHANLLHWAKKGTPFIYVQDSYDALDALEDQKKASEMADAIEKDKGTAGSYGMAKAKAGSSILRSTVSSLARTKSALFIVSQIRDNVDPMSPKKETRSGGHALKFYAAHEMWMKPVKTLKKKDTIIGSRIRVRISKNKLTGKHREVEFDVYQDYGIDDIGSCIDYLIEIGRWTGGGQKRIDHCGDFELGECTKSKLVRYIESEGLEKKLKRLVGIEWKAFEDSLKLGRKAKYD